MGKLKSLLPSGELLQQLIVYQVLGQLLSGALQPFSQELANVMNSLFQFVPIAPPDLADMVTRSHIDLSAAVAMAKMSGTSEANFNLLVANVGQPPAPQQLLEAWRRGFIPETGSGAGSISLVQGIRESRTMDKWIPVIQQLGLQIIAPSQAVDAWVRGQISEADAKKIIYQNGLDETSATILYNTTGNPPSPTQLLELNRRGFIPMQGVGPTETTVQQGIYEGSMKDKWEPLMEKLVVYLPPPRTVTALERAGAIPASQAQQLYQQAGLSSQLAAVYSHDATMAKVAAAKQLAESTVLSLYEAKAITPAEADGYLADLGYDAQEAHYIEAVSDLKKELAMLNSAVSKVRSLYIARRITRASAITALNQLGVAAAQVTQELAIWDLEQGETVRLLSESQIADAFKYGILDQPTAQAELVNLGYTPYDAWVLLGVTMHVAQPNPPSQGPSPSGNVT